MPPNISDGIVLLKPHDQWPNPKETIDELRTRMLQFVNQIIVITVNSRNRLNYVLMNSFQASVVISG